MGSATTCGSGTTSGATWPDRPGGWSAGTSGRTVTPVAGTAAGLTSTSSAEISTQCCTRRTDRTDRADRALHGWYDDHGPGRPTAGAVRRPSDRRGPGVDLDGQVG